MYNLPSSIKGRFPFVEDSFNRHSAVRITDYVIDAENLYLVLYIWNNENYV